MPKTASKDSTGMYKLQSLSGSEQYCSRSLNCPCMFLPREELDANISISEQLLWRNHSLPSLKGRHCCQPQNNRLVANADKSRFSKRKPCISATRICHSDRNTRETCGQIWGSASLTWRRCYLKGLPNEQWVLCHWSWADQLAEEIRKSSLPEHMDVYLSPAGRDCESIPAGDWRLAATFENTAE